MIFPIGDDQVVGGVRPYVSYAFIGINVLLFLLQFFMHMSQGDQWLGQFFMEYGAVPAKVMAGDGTLSLLTSMFLHGGWMHLIGNMLFLWVFADNIEATIGSVAFLMYYLLGGLAGSMAHILTDTASMTPGIGASGAIAAVLGTYLILYPKSRIKMIIIFMGSSFYIPALFFLVFWIGQQLLSGVGSLTGGEAGGVAWWAHIGGFAFGVVAGLIIKMVFPPKELTAVTQTRTLARR